MARPITAITGPATAQKVSPDMALPPMTPTSWSVIMTPASVTRAPTPARMIILMMLPLSWPVGCGPVYAVVLGTAWPRADVLGRVATEVASQVNGRPGRDPLSWVTAGCSRVATAVLESDHPLPPGGQEPRSSTRLLGRGRRSALRIDGDSHRPAHRVVL